MGGKKSNSPKDGHNRKRHMSKNFKIRQIENGTFQILRASVDEWGKPNGGWFVYDVASTRAEAVRKAR